MKNSFIKIISLLLIIGLNWFGLSAVGRTSAYFNDMENSQGNVYSVGTLDFLLDSPQDNFGPRPEVALNMMPGDSVSREIKVENLGSLPFQYLASSAKIIGDDDFCQNLRLMADLDGEIKYYGSLMDFNFSAIEISGSEDNWFFVISLPYSSNFQNKVCQFKFVFKGWQDNVENYEESGFTDIEEIVSNLASWGLRINEVYYDVAPDKGTEPNDEWIELYNPTNQDINIKDWTITDNTYSRTIHSNNTTIPGGGFAVVSKDASTWAPGMGYWTLPAGTTKIILGLNIGNGLANEGDRVILSRADGTEIDAMSYGNDTYAFVPACPDVDEGHSLARRIAGYDTNQASDWEDLVTPNPGINPHLINDEEIVTEEFIVSEEETEEEVEIIEGDLTEAITEEETSEEETIISEENAPEETIPEETNPEETVAETESLTNESESTETGGEAAADGEEAPTTEEEVTEETEVPVIEDIPIIEETPTDEASAIEEQPAVEEEPVPEEQTEEESSIIEGTDAEEVSPTEENPTTEEAPIIEENSNEETPIIKEAPVIDGESEEQSTNENE